MSCPNCGYCEKCGRANQPAYQPYWYWNPNYITTPYPQPIPVTVSGGTFTVTTDHTVS